MMRFCVLLLLATALPHALSAQGRAALDSVNASAATADYQRTGRARVVQAGTYSMVPYGHIQPTVQCAPLRVCTIELQRGERVIDSALPDRERWVVDFATGPDSTPLVVIKPVALPNACDLTTNLVVTTNLRIYHVTLDSPPCPGQEESTNPALPYQTHVKFYYPDDAALVTHHGSGTAGRPLRASPPVDAFSEAGSAMAVSELGDLHFDYQVVPDRGFPWRPKVVFDNGRQTCVRLPPEAHHNDLAVLYELNAQGRYELVQYVVRDGCILTDRVMLRMVLIITAGGGDPLRLLIVRRPARGDR
jgi:P-type conjugative transfer protein TrbG